jgi:cardiolipin synthase
MDNYVRKCGPLVSPLSLDHIGRRKENAGNVGLTIPNLITILRFLLVPGVIYALLSHQWGWAFGGFLVAGISDAVDGFIARQFHQVSSLGSYLDPVADKVLLVSVFIVLGYLGQLPLWLVIAVVSRDALIVCAVLLSSVMGNPVEMKPLLVSKANTAVQIVLAAFILGEQALGADTGAMRTILVASSGLLTIASAAAYLVAWLRHMTNGENAPTNR